MPCLLILIAVIAPRLTLFLMWRSAYTASVFETDMTMAVKQKCDDLIAK